MTTSTANANDSNQSPSPKSRWSPWLGILSGPIAWILQLIVGYGFVPYACDHGTKVSLYVLAGIAALITVGAGYMAWRQWGFVGQRHLMDLTDPKQTLSFLSSFGLLMSLLFFVLIAVTGIYAIFSSPCPLITMKLP